MVFFFFIIFILKKLAKKTKIKTKNNNLNSNTSEIDMWQARNVFQHLFLCNIPPFSTFEYTHLMCIPKYEYSIGNGLVYLYAKI